MKIAVNTRFLLKNKLEGIGWFTYETMKRLAERHPEHEFYFFFDRPFDNSFIFSKNITPVVLFPPARHPFLWYWWFEISVKKTLKKIQPDVFISTDGYLSLSSDVQTILVIHDLAFEHYPEFIKGLTAKYYRHFTPKFVSKAKKIITVSEATKNDVVKYYGTDSSKIVVAHNGANEKFKPISEQERVENRNRFSEGKNYFVYAGSLHPRKNISNLLKAFDDFKFKTKCDYKLLLAGARGWMLQETDEIFNKMQFKQDVIFTGHLETEDLVKVVGSAYAMVYVSFFEGFGIPIVEAMQCNVPVITSNVSSMPEVAGDAGLLVNPNRVDEISNAMIEIFSNSDLRNVLIERGKVQCKKFSWDKTAEIIWNVVEEVAGSK